MERSETCSCTDPESYCILCESDLCTECEKCVHNLEEDYPDDLEE